MIIQLKRFSVLVIDERIQIESSLLPGAAAQNIRQCIFNGSNTKEYWGGLQVVLLLGDDCQLLPVAGSGAINGCADRNEEHVGHTDKKENRKEFLVKKENFYSSTTCQETFLN